MPKVGDGLEGSRQHRMEIGADTTVPKLDLFIDIHILLAASPNKDSLT